MNEPSEPHTEGLSVIVDPETPTVDIVFVHGFTGHPKRTWSCKAEGSSIERQPAADEGERPSKIRRLLPHAKPMDSGTQNTKKEVYWPRDLLPESFPHARVLTFGYDTRIKHWAAGSSVSQSTVYDIAWDFLVALESKRRNELSRPLLLVAHSLGGIVVKEALRRSHGCVMHQTRLRSIHDSTCGIIFFGTPHGGADPRGIIHRVAQKCIEAMGWSVNEQIVQTLLPTSERLRELRDEFVPIIRHRRWTVYCFQEQYPVKALGSKVVEDTASCFNDVGVETTQHIAKNHMDICRFMDCSDLEYEKVVAAFHHILQSVQREAVQPDAKRPARSEEQLTEFMGFLKFNQMDVRLASIKAAHAKTCRWFLKDSYFLDWLDERKVAEHHGFLWIKGKPGSGKSTMMKFLSGHSKKAMQGTILISFFFNARGTELEKSTEGLYRSLLLQLFDAAPDLRDAFDLLPSPSYGHNQSLRWTIELLNNLFSHAIEQLGKRRLICYIDALDECDENQIREMISLFETLGQYAVSSDVWFRVCLSSRHYPHISIRKGLSLTLEGCEGHEKDIDKYLQSQFKAGTGTLIEDMRAEILSRASGIFMWVVLVVQILNKESDRGSGMRRLRKRLDELPNGLNELFKEILTRDSQGADELMLCLQWVLYAARPLKPAELYHAIISGTNPDELCPWTSDEISPEGILRFILNCSKGLAEPTRSKDPTVQLIHESVRDFLLKENGLCQIWPEMGQNLARSSHERLKACCRSYLSLDFLNHVNSTPELEPPKSLEILESQKSVTDKFPFIPYVIQNILYHAESAENSNHSQIAFLEAFPMGTWSILSILFEKFQIRRHSRKVTLAYILAEKGYEGLIQQWIKTHSFVDAEYERWGSPLGAAIANKHESTVQFLLRETETERQMKTDVGPCLLTAAVDTVQESLVRTLLDHGVKPGPRNKKRGSLLQLALSTGDKTIIRMIIDKALDTTSLNDIFGSEEPQLRWAVWACQNAKVSDDRGVPTDCTSLEDDMDAVVEMLFESRRGLKDRSWLKPTPLHYAARSGHTVTIKTLIKYGADVSSQDKDKKTPLHLAAQEGAGSSVEALIKCGADVNAKCTLLLTPLCSAVAASSYTSYWIYGFNVLMENGADIHAKTKDGSTPIHFAARSRNEHAVRTLCQQGADLDARDSSGRTALHDAISKHRDVNLIGGVFGIGDVSVITVLIEHGADINAVDAEKRTSPHLASSPEAPGSFLDELLQHKPNLSIKDSSGLTALDLLMTTHLNDGQIRPALKMLNQALQEHDTFPEINRVFGCFTTKWNNNELKRLVSREAGSHEVLDWSVRHGDPLLASIMLVRGADASVPNESGNLPLHEAVYRGDRFLVDMLLNYGADVNAMNRWTLSPAMIALQKSRISIFKALVYNGANVNACYSDGDTMLHTAVKNNNSSAVETIRHSGRANFDARNSRNRTALEYAYELGIPGMARRLRRKCNALR